MSYIPNVDELACVGHGDCAVIAPDVFVLDDIATVVATGPDEMILNAARACPSVAISVIDAQSGEQVYP
jgi:ferredoxin